MDKLIIFNGILVIFIALGLFLIKKRVQTERARAIILLAAAVRKRFFFALVIAV